MSEDEGPVRHKPWRLVPGAPSEHAQEWLSQSDDELLYRIEGLPRDHAHDRTLLDVIRSNRHFFIRQEAAKKLRDRELLKEHSGDRHIGQILVRGLTRSEDVCYLQKLI